MFDNTRIRKKKVLIYILVKEVHTRKSSKMISTSGTNRTKTLSNENILSNFEPFLIRIEISVRDRELKFLPPSFDSILQILVSIFEKKSWSFNVMIKMGQKYYNTLCTKICSSETICNAVTSRSHAWHYYEYNLHYSDG